MEKDSIKGKSWRKERERKKIAGTKESTDDSSNKQHIPAITEVKNKEVLPAQDKKVDEPSAAKENSGNHTNQVVDVSGIMIQAEEDAKKLESEEKETLEQYVKEQEERLAKRKKLLEANLAAFTDRPELNTSKLDSSLKKNTAFIKKLKSMTETQHEALEKELMSLNLSKYVSEVAQALVEARLKMSNISTAVHMCSLLHQRYSDFSQILLTNWHKVFNIKKDERVSNLSKLRVDLRLFAELTSAGIFQQKEGLPLLGNLLTTLVNTDKEEHQYISVLLTFCKYCGDDFMGLVPRNISVLGKKFKTEIPRSKFLPSERQKNVRSLMKDYFETLVTHLFKDHKELNKVEQQNLRILQTRGELTDERKHLAENLSTSLNKLLTNAQNFSNMLDEDIPVLPVIKSAEEEACPEKMLIDGDAIDTSAASPWEDDDMRAFYTSLPQLKALLPSILYSESEKATLPTQSTKVEDNQEGENLDDFDENAKGEDEAEEDIAPPELPAEDEIEDTSPTSNKVVLEAFLSSLSNCISRDLIDSAALEFCLNLNTKPCRRKLVKSIFLVPRTRLDLLPFYARLVASLRPLMPDLATDLVNMLKQDFRYQVKKKDQINIESKIKVARFIGELVKFEIYPRGEALICIRMLLQDFRHHHIEMACNLLETCGRYLYRLPDSHYRTKIYLEQMMRKKTAKAFEPRYNTMIENAYYYVNPPASTADTTKVERPPMHQYIRRLLYVVPSKANADKILRQIRKLHWEDSEIARYTVKCLIAVWNAKYYNIRCIANLLAGLVAHHDWIGPHVVDGILEDIKLGLEVNEPKYNQRRIAAAKYLGELYNYRIIDSALIFKVLYSLLTFGVTWDPDNISPYDPPDHLMRIRLVCTILDTCGQYFNSGSSKKRLDCFLTYFQHYFQLKKYFWPSGDFPWQVDHMATDTITVLRPKITLYKDVEEAQQAVDALNQQIVNKAMQLSPELKKMFEENEKENEVGLATISEEMESIEEIDLVGDDIFLEEDEDDAEKERKFSPDGDWEPEGEGSFSQTPSQLSQSKATIEEGGSLSEANEDVDVKFSVKKIDCTEDTDFMSAFDQMLADSMLERTRDTPRANQSNISVPVNIKSTCKKNYDQIMSEEVDEGEEVKPVVNFVLLTKSSGNKTQYANVEMPVDSDIVTKLRTREVAEKAERDIMKQRTLEINERQEEEEAFELIQQAQKPPPLNVNRERRPKYQHPKGAPDVDLIFGSKKVR